MISESNQALETLLAGNRRFQTGQTEPRTYSPEDLRTIASFQKPFAAIIACMDSRVTPEIIFDQPLGSMFVARVPGNVASDSAKWMLDIAVGDMHVPLVVVLGHTGCLAVKQLLEGDKGGPGGPLRHEVMQAVYEARSHGPEDLYREAVIQNAVLSAQKLKRDSLALYQALEEGRVTMVTALYEMETGEVHIV